MRALLIRIRYIVEKVFKVKLDDDKNEKKISFKKNLEFPPDMKRGLSAEYIKENTELSFIVHLDKPGSSKICAYESGGPSCGLFESTLPALMPRRACV